MWCTCLVSAPTERTAPRSLSQHCALHKMRNTLWVVLWERTQTYHFRNVDPFSKGSSSNENASECELKLLSIHSRRARKQHSSLQTALRFISIALETATESGRLSDTSVSMEQHNYILFSRKRCDAQKEMSCILAHRTTKPVISHCQSPPHSDQSVQTCVYQRTEESHALTHRKIQLSCQALEMPQRPFKQPSTC